MSLEAVLKIGGSLSRGNGLEDLCREICRLGEIHRIVIVPGGGAFADQVRDTYTRFRLDETTAHHMALLAMDQYGCLLHYLMPGSVLTADLACARHEAESGKPAILLPTAAVLQDDSLPHSWQVTSDTISAWIARMSDCRRLIILKDVDGLMAVQDIRSGPVGLILELTIEQLAKHRGGVDEYLSHFLAAEPLETWVINGRHPGRLVELLERSYTTGTRILRK